MALTLRQYAAYLDTRDLPWPRPPEVERPKAKPYLVHLPETRVVTWSAYGTLLHISEGELLFEHPDRFVMEMALDKLIQEFRMWASMSRKPGSPAKYLEQIYTNLLGEQRRRPSPGEKYPEILADRLWEAFVKKLLQKDYRFDANFYGSLNEFSRKLAYFFHASVQGTGCYPGAARALNYLKTSGFTQGLITDAQCFTLVQLERGLAEQDAEAKLDELFDPELRACSFEVGARKPSEKLFKQLLGALEQRGIPAERVLHIGSRIAHDVIPARKLGMKTALFAGDRASLQATPDQLKDSTSRPDVLLTELSQIADVVGEGFPDAS